MGDLCRSADMVFLQVLVPRDASESFADEMSRRDIMMFVDLNENVQMFQREYIKDITRINETERALRNVQSFFLEFEACTEEDLEITSDIIKHSPRATDLNLYDLADDIQKFYVDLAQQVVSSRALAAQGERLKDQLEVLMSLDTFLADAPQYRRESFVPDGMGVPLQNADRDVGFKYLAGVCPIVKLPTLRKQIFHITRGNRYFKAETLEDGNKAAFVVFFIGTYVRDMIKKFCEWMDVEIFLDNTENIDQENLKIEVQSKIRDNQDLLLHTETRLKRMMQDRKQDVITWNIQLKQEMAIRVLLNKFKVRGKSNMLRAEGWVAERHAPSVEEALKLSKAEGGLVEKIAGKGVKPTYFETNKFTAAFQMIIDTYGVPRNGEFNPTVPSIVTFPFLFAMMYGDIFHGTFLFLGAFWLVWNEEANEKSKNEFIAGIHTGRYLLLLMGLFAIYNGLIYNDCTSISLNGFNGSQWSNAHIVPLDPSIPEYDVENGKVSGVYAFGIDPVWSTSSEQLSTMNSLKMKLSVLVGITQMTFGLFIKLSNHIHEGDYLSIYGEFIPQLIFMLVFFGYMQFIIIYKWCQDWTGKVPPSLITALVNMVLKPGTIEEENHLFDDGDLQATVQVIFLGLMGISIPWMLLTKPLILRSRAKRAMANGEDMEAFMHDNHVHGDSHTFEFSGIMIEQIIHTIEYVLGTISNTASYLRLWALSLAHAQLAEVFYDKTIKTGMESGSGIMTFVCVAAFFAFTFAVLMMMDVLECFLHALRLHWVEFQNKFYYADGVAFLPYSYDAFLEK